MWPWKPRDGLGTQAPAPTATAAMVDGGNPSLRIMASRSTISLPDLFELFSDRRPPPLRLRQQDRGAPKLPSCSSCGGPVAANLSQPEGMVEVDELCVGGRERKRTRSLGYRGPSGKQPVPVMGERGGKPSPSVGSMLAPLARDGGRAMDQQAVTPLATADPVGRMGQGQRCYQLLGPDYRSGSNTNSGTTTSQASHWRQR